MKHGLLGNRRRLALLALGSEGAGGLPAVARARAALVVALALVLLLIAATTTATATTIATPRACEQPSSARCSSAVNSSNSISPDLSSSISPMRRRKPKGA